MRTGLVRHIFCRKPRLKTRRIALPELSGPKAMKKLAGTEKRRNSANRFGTPSFSPMQVSTSTLMASGITARPPRLRRGAPSPSPTAHRRGAAGHRPEASPKTPLHPSPAPSSRLLPQSVPDTKPMLVDECPAPQHLFALQLNPRQEQLAFTGSDHATPISDPENRAGYPSLLP